MSTVCGDREKEERSFSVIVTRAARHHGQFPQWLRSYWQRHHLPLTVVAAI